MNETNQYHIIDALLICALAMHFEATKTNVRNAAIRIRDNCDAQARTFVVNYVLIAKDPVALIKQALVEVEMFL